jgi:tetratricopeptide (TPR) repeat protein
LLGEIALEVSDRDGGDYDYSLRVMGVISRCYEALGAFSEAIEWKLRQRGPYCDLARLYLKQGAFAKAGEAFQQYCVLNKEKNNPASHSGSYAEHLRLSHTQNQIVCAHLYLLGGDEKHYTEIIDSLVKEYRARGQLSDLATVLEEEGFLEEAMKIHDEISGRTYRKKADTSNQ